MSIHFRWLAFVVILTGVAFWLVLPDTQPEFLLRGGNAEQLDDCLLTTPEDQQEACDEFRGAFEYQLGLDLVGGLRVRLRAELPEEAIGEGDLTETKNSIERRVNALGTTEAIVQVVGQDGILVELPGETDPDRAISTIQQTALLEFVDFSGLAQSFEGQVILTTLQDEVNRNREALAAERGEEFEPDPAFEAALRNPLTGLPFQTVMTGDGLSAAREGFDPNRGIWTISFQIADDHEIVHPDYNSFGEFTRSKAVTTEPMAIVLDGVVLSAPSIQSEISTTGEITGAFTEEEARTLALQLRSGALSIPLRVESTELVGATLGDESVQASIRAGVVGVIVVLTFMLTYYRVPGVAADFALIVFAILNLAVFKLVPITMTLPAVTGFLIGIGTAVDGNILIFERLKEEIRSGKDLDEALDAGFSRAWTSIRDSNISTIIICGILFLFGQTPGASRVSGFAITLALGLALNLFTAVFVTRTFLYVIVAVAREPVAKRRWLLGI